MILTKLSCTLTWYFDSLLLQPWIELFSDLNLSSPLLPIPVIWHPPLTSSVISYMFLTCSRVLVDVSLLCSLSWRAVPADWLVVLEEAFVHCGAFLISKDSQHDLVKLRVGDRLVVVGCRLVVGVFWTSEYAILSRVVRDGWWTKTLWQSVAHYLEAVNLTHELCLELVVWGGRVSAVWLSNKCGDSWVIARSAYLDGCCEALSCSEVWTWEKFWAVSSLLWFLLQIFYRRTEKRYVELKVKPT